MHLCTELLLRGIILQAQHGTNKVLTNLCWNWEASRPIPYPAWVWGWKRFTLGQRITSSYTGQSLWVYMDLHHLKGGDLIWAAQNWAVLSGNRIRYQCWILAHPLTTRLPTTHLFPTLKHLPSALLMPNPYTSLEKTNADLLDAGSESAWRDWCMSLCQTHMSHLTAYLCHYWASAKELDQGALRIVP